MWYKELLKLVAMVAVQKLTSSSKTSPSSRPDFHSEHDVLMTDAYSLNNVSNTLKLYSAANFVNLNNNANTIGDGLADYQLSDMLRYADQQFNKQRPQNSVNQFTSSWINGLVSSYLMKGAPMWTQAIGMSIDNPKSRPLLSGLLTDSAVVTSTLSLMDNAFGPEKKDGTYVGLSRPELVDLLVNDSTSPLLYDFLSTQKMDINHYIPYRMLSSYKSMSRSFDAVDPATRHGKVERVGIKLMPPLDLHGAAFYSQSYSPPIPNVRGSVADIRESLAISLSKKK